jgi:hypothetical protein
MSVRYFFSKFALLLVYLKVHEVQQSMYVMCQTLYRFINSHCIFTVMGVCAVDKVYMPRLEDLRVVLFGV